MTVTCPCCKSVVEVPLLVDLNTNTVTVPEHHIKLWPKEAEILYTLWQKFPATVSRNSIMTALYGRHDEPETDHVVTVLIANIRRKVRETSIKVKAVHKRGYRLELG